jgi:hypothetical protein
VLIQTTDPLIDHAFGGDKAESRDDRTKQLSDLVMCSWVQKAKAASAWHLTQNLRRSKLMR